MIHLLRRIYWHNFFGQKIASGPVAQLGAHHIRIHMQTHPTALVPFQFSSPFSRTYPSKLNISKIRFS